MAEDPSNRYLDELTARLRLPEPYASEVREEIAAHLSDTREGLLAEGLTEEQAEREATARLGSPAVLADELRRSHQTRRRLLAGAAGGVYAAGGQAIHGTIVGLALVLLGLVLVGLLVAGLSRLGVDPAAGIEATVPYQSQNTVLASLALAIGAIFAARAAVRASAATSRRLPRSLARWWATCGAVAIVAWELFVWQTSLSWPAFFAEILIPVAFVAGATFRVDRPDPRIPHLRLMAVGIVLLAVVLPVLGLMAMTSVGSSSVQSEGRGPYQSIAEMWHADGRDRVGAVPPESVRSSVEDLGWLGDKGLLAPSVHADAAALAGWHDFRYEAWVPTTGEGELLVASSRPFAVAPATFANGRISGTIRVDRTPGVAHYALFLTGVGPDGQRYLLSGPAISQTGFFGTLWDWLASQ